jgi:hypothetical protein
MAMPTGVLHRLCGSDRESGSRAEGTVVEFEWGQALIGCSASREWPLEPLRAIRW